MKEFYVDLDVTFSTRMYVYAEDEESAKAQAVLLVDNDPRYHTRMGAHVSTDVTDIFEE
jgi:hypothetical protein